MAETPRDLMPETMTSEEIADYSAATGQVIQAVKLRTKDFAQGTTAVFPLTDHTTASYVCDGEGVWHLAEEIRGDVADYVEEGSS